MDIGKLAVISFDVEQDCPPYLDTWHGLEEGMPRILELLEELNVRATFFATGESVEKAPRLFRNLVDQGHELGVHGYRHERLDRLPPGEAARVIEKATRAVARVTTPLSFRAPNLRPPPGLHRVLVSLGYRYDSSTALYKPPFQRAPRIVEGIVVIPASATSSVLRLPWRLQRILHSLLPGPRVYFSHPWEYVDMTGTRVRLDCRFNTGEKALLLLRRLIEWLRSRGYRLVTLAELGEAVLRSMERNSTVRSCSGSALPAQRRG